LDHSTVLNATALQRIQPKKGDLENSRMPELRSIHLEPRVVAQSFAGLHGRTTNITNMAELDDRFLTIRRRK
jgi:hypothetical protein